ncbi:MAG: hypothetical protein M3Y89_16965 [Actinomycetota bacterium]|nr:hypothetical protein [Actinomycetota bacterium]
MDPAAAVGGDRDQAVGATPGLVTAVHHEEPAFVLDVWRWATGAGG